MDFRADDHFAADLEAVLAAYADPALPRAIGALAPLSAGELVDQTHAGDTVILRVRYAYRGDLPPGASAIVDPSRLSWVQVTELDRATGQASVVLEPDNYADRLRARAVQRFAVAEAGGTDRRTEGSVSVKLLMAGRAVERALVSGLEAWLTNEAVAVDRWLADGSPRPG